MSRQIHHRQPDNDDNNSNDNNDTIDVPVRRHPQQDHHHHQQQHDMFEFDRNHIENDTNAMEDDDDGITRVMIQTKEKDNNNMSLSNDSVNDAKQRANTNQLGITIALCVCMFAHSYLVMSVFPYSPFLALRVVQQQQYLTYHDHHYRYLPVEEINETTTNLNYNNTTTTTENTTNSTRSIDDASMVAGMIASSFMFGRAATALVWGYIADQYGRVVVLQASLMFSFVFSLCFGFVNQSLLLVLFVRFLLGCSNGIMGTIKTIVSELKFPPAGGGEGAVAVTKKGSETRLMSIVMGMWGWGLLLSPALAGTLSDPIKQYYTDPDATTTTGYWSNLYRGSLEPNTFTGNLLRKYPFVLPNIVGALLCLISIILVYIYVPETLVSKNLPDEERNRETNVRLWVNYLLSLICKSFCKQQSANYTKVKSHDETDNIPEVELSNTSVDNDDEVDDDDDENQRERYNDKLLERTPNKKIETKSTDSSSSSSPSSPLIQMIQYILFSEKRDALNCLLIYWAYSFANVAVDELLPLFLVSDTAGFGLNEKDVGTLLSACGLMYATAQYSVQKYLYDHHGNYGTLRISITFLPPTLFVIPFSILINNLQQRHYDESSSTAETGSNNSYTLHWMGFWFIAIVLFVYKVMAISFFTAISVACNHTVPSEQRGTLNGISVLGGSFAKGLGPAFAGIVVSCSIKWFHQYASIAMFGSLAVISSMVAGSVFILLPINTGNNS